MQWLQPWAWVGLGALVLPVLIHLLSRRPARTVAFPSLRFLPPTALRPTRRTRVSDWPLLLIRLAMLAAAVAALAQPVRRAIGTRSDTTISRVTLVDTLTTVLGPTAPTPTATGERLLTDDLAAGIASAIARLRGLPAPRELTVVSTFAVGLVDSTAFAAIPQDVTLRLVVSPARADARLARTDTLRWRTSLTSDVTDPVQQAVAGAGGAPMVRRTDSLITTSGSPAMEWLVRAARDRSAVVLARVARQEVVQALATMAAPTETRWTTTSTPLVWDATGAPRVVARQLGDTLVIATDVLTADMALALALAIGGVTAVPSTPVVADSATRARWAMLPAAPPIGAGAMATDVHRVATDARWGWALVLVLLVAETVMRRRATIEGTVETTARTTAASTARPS